MTQTNRKNRQEATRFPLARIGLRRSIQLALASSALVTGMADAVLRDRGPSDPVVAYPTWYRDFNDLALGQCKYADDAGNGPLCLTTPADTDPAGFPGNLGEEAFYTTFAEFLPVNGGSNFDFGAALEMAYFSGPPPAVRNPATPDEIVFSRIRMRMDVPAGCGGHYTIYHPYGKNELDAEEGVRGINFTDDILPISGDFNAALAGHQGPFITWDTDLPITVTPPVGAAREYIGDPNVEHTYTGSAIVTPADIKALLPGGGLEPRYDRQNFILVVAPAGCDLDGDNILFSETATISGVKWTQAIPTPTRIDRAAYTRTAGGDIALDVWASSAPNQNLALTAADTNAPGLPSTRMKQNTTPSGTYYSHLELATGANPPAQVTLTNLSSNPAINESRAVVDAVEITKAVYDPLTKTLCVTAHSGDEQSPVPINLVAPSYGGFSPDATPTCPKADPRDQVLEKDLAGFLPDVISPPTTVFVRSTLGGSETKEVTSKTGLSDAGVINWAVDDVGAAKFDNVSGTGSTPLNVGQNDALPANARIVVVSQPEVVVNNELVPSGTVTAPAAGGTVTYAAAEGRPTHDTFFYYAIQDTVNNTVSNVAKAELHVVEAIAPPVGVADNFAIFRTNTVTGFTANVLSNDVPGVGGYPIDPATVQINTNGARGTATANANGTITYRVTNAPAGQNWPDSFTYTVANNRGTRSNPITVSVVIENLGEVLTPSRVRFSAPRWDIRFTTTWFGAPLTPIGTCWLTTNSAGVVIAPQLIGSAPADAAGAFQIVAVPTAPTVTGSAWRVTCKTSNTTGAGMVSGSR